MTYDPNHRLLYVPVLQIIINYWIAELGLPQGAVLLFIAERTLRYGKQWEYIRYAHFIGGIQRNGAASPLHHGLGISRATVARCLTELEALELIYVSRSNRHLGGSFKGCSYSLNTSTLLTAIADSSDINDVRSYENRS
jgi:hypothetical protein